MIIKALHNFPGGLDLSSQEILQDSQASIEQLQFRLTIFPGQSIEAEDKWYPLKNIQSALNLGYIQILNYNSETIYDYEITTPESLTNNYSLTKVEIINRSDYPQDAFNKYNQNFNIIDNLFANGSSVQTFVDLTDTPASYVGQNDKIVSVKSDGTGLEFSNSVSSAWGAITGTLSDQTDLQNELNTKANISGQIFTGNVSATNLIGINTGDETNASIKSKLTQANTSSDGYLASSDWNTFNNKISNVSGEDHSTLSNLDYASSGHTGFEPNIGYTPENIANKSNSSSLGISSTLYPTQAAVKTYVDNLVSATIKLQGSWDADTNTPDITVTTETGYAWRVSVDGNTDLGGITDWKIGDLAVKTDPDWMKIDNTEASVLWGSIAGTLSDQTDLQNELNAKANVNGQIFTGNVSATNLSGLNTGDETKSSIESKLNAANVSNDGYLTSTDWSTFNNKIANVSGENHSTLNNLDYAGAGHTGFEPTVTKGNLSSSNSVIQISNGSSSIIGDGTQIDITQADTSSDGYLTSSDWNTFNNSASGTYLFLDTSNGPLTGDLGISKADPGIRLTDTTNDKYLDLKMGDTESNLTQSIEWIPNGVAFKSDDTSGEGYLNFNTVINATEGTVSFWFKPSKNHIDNWGTPFNAAAGWNYFRFYRSSLTECQFRTDQIGGQVIVTTTLDAGIWYHVVLTWLVGGNKHAYIDNVKYSKATDTVNTGWGASQAYVGGTNLNRKDTWGAYDEINYWNRQLTDAEISELYNGGYGLYMNTTGSFASTATPYSTNLLRIYHCDETSGTVATDSSLNQDGTYTLGYSLNQAGKVVAVSLTSVLDFITIADSGINNLKGIMTVGNSEGRTIVDGKTIRFNTNGVEQFYMDSLGDLVFPDNQITYFGTGKDSSIYYDGADLIINPQEIGSGDTLFETGKVGIGTTTPTAKVDIETSGTGTSGIKITNTDTGTGNRYAGINLFNDASSEGSLFKTNTGYTTYKTITAGDLGFYNSVGNITILADHTDGEILLSSGGNSTPQLQIDKFTNVKMPNDNAKFYQGAGDDYSQYFDGTDQQFTLTSGDFKFNTGNIALSANNQSLILGAGQDASIYYDGTDMVINPDEVGTGILKIDGGISKPISIKTNDYTILNSDYTIVANGASNTVTITLPTSPNTGQIYNIKSKDSTNTVTIARNGKNIDGDASDVTLISKENVKLQYDGVDTWWII